jgi:hypothetical protein
MPRGDRHHLANGSTVSSSERASNAALESTTLGLLKAYFKQKGKWECWAKKSQEASG